MRSLLLDAAAVASLAVARRLLVVASWADRVADDKAGGEERGEKVKREEESRGRDTHRRGEEESKKEVWTDRIREINAKQQSKHTPGY